MPRDYLVCGIPRKSGDHHPLVVSFFPFDPGIFSEEKEWAVPREKKEWL